MTRVEGEIVINRPVEEVFDFVADERHEPRFNPNVLAVEKLTPGPIGKGTRFRTEIRTRSRTAQMTVEFTDYDRPGRLSSISQLSNMTIEGTLTFDSIAEGTRICAGPGISFPAASSSSRRRSSRP